MPEMPDAIVLCGGAGLRLRSVTGEAPKSTVHIGGRPFLEILFRQLRHYGWRRVVLAIGYQGHVIRSEFGDQVFGMELVYSNEASPLGTGGALRNAVDLISSKCALVMNGDSYTDVALDEFVADYRGSKADAAIVVVPADGRTDCGTVLLDGNRKITGFAEKQQTPGSLYTNAGVYLMSRASLLNIPAGKKISVEEEVFPYWLMEGVHMRAFVGSGKCIDIGTPDRYVNAQHVLSKVDATMDAGTIERQK